MCGHPGHNEQPHPRLPPSFSRYGCMDDLTTEPALIWKLRGSLMCLAFYMTY